MSSEHQRGLITAVWLAGFLGSLFVACSYQFARDGNGVTLLTWSEVSQVLRSVCLVYGAYLGGILAFWFLKPFRLRGRTVLERIRFALAMGGAVLVNAAFLGWTLIGYWNAPSATLQDILDARNAVLWMSFVVAPANLYYFGVREAV